MSTASAVRSCVTPLSSIGSGQKVVTLEGLGTPQRPHPVQRAFIEEQAVQCGYCINGMIMESAAFLAKNKRADRGGDQAGARQQPLPLRNARPHRQGCASARPTASEGGSHEQHVKPSRRDVLKGGGALVVSFSLPGMRRGARAGRARRQGRWR